MSLGDFQQALARAVRGDAGPDDRVRLGAIADAPGLALTGRIRRAWCEGRAARAAPLTLGAFTPDDRAAALAAWADAGGGTASYADFEAEAFLAFLLARCAEPSHAATLARFEAAIARARMAPCPARVALTPTSRLVRAPGATLLAVPESIGAIAAAAQGRGPWPPLGGPTVAMLAAPGIEGWVRAITPAEQRLWRHGATGVEAGAAIRAARKLVAEGALVAAN